MFDHAMPTLRYLIQESPSMLMYFLGRCPCAALKPFYRSLSTSTYMRCVTALCEALQNPVNYLTTAKPKLATILSEIFNNIQFWTPDTHKPDQRVGTRTPQTPNDNTGPTTDTPTRTLSLNHTLQHTHIHVLRADVIQKQTSCKLHATHTGPAHTTLR